MIIKSGKHNFLLTESDVILDNGSCIQLVSKKIGIGWNTSIPIIGKTNWNKYLKTGNFELVKEDKYLKYYKLKGE